MTSGLGGSVPGFSAVAVSSRFNQVYYRNQWRRKRDCVKACLQESLLVQACETTEVFRPTPIDKKFDTYTIKIPSPDVNADVVVFSRPLHLSCDNRYTDTVRCHHYSVSRYINLNLSGLKALLKLNFEKKIEH